MASSLSAQQSSMPAQNPTGAPLTTVALQIGDVLRIYVWREPTLTGDFPVDQYGMITLPMLGARKADGVPWTALRDSLLAGFQRQVKTDAITLTPLRRVYVLGSVLRPGLYMLDPTFGLQGAVSLAGGAGPDGDLDHIRVLRDGAVVVDRISVKKAVSQFEVRSGDQVFVERRGWFDRNSTLLLTSVISLAGIVVSLASRN
ncbi:MAG: polysaccharide biosynthesis/export family protein [Gemmatimonadaceae bacterium]